MTIYRVSMSLITPLDYWIEADSSDEATRLAHSYDNISKEERYPDLAEVNHCETVEVSELGE